jgi:hypothetical protein
MPIAEKEEAGAMSAIQKAKAKNARLRLMKERNEIYLAEQREEREVEDQELTQELRVSTSQ